MKEVALSAEQDDEHGFFTTHMLTLAMAFFFAVLGSEKLLGDRHWVDVFQRIGFGQWFRYFTGAVQIGGAALATVRRTTLAGLFLLGSTMIGAMMATVMVLGSYSDAAFPGIFFLAIVGAAAIE